VNQPATLTFIASPLREKLLRTLLASFVVILCLQTLLFSQTQISTSPDDKTLIVEDAPEMEVYALGKSVIVKQRAKGVLAFGGDVIVEGRVDGDVAAIGGSIIQKDQAYIGGDIIVFGGSYKPESREPLREPGKETVMFGAFEDELRNVAQNPTQIFSPSLTFTFFAHRLLSLLFWFILSLGLTTIAPGAIGRAVARVQLSAMKVLGIGIVSFLLILIGVVLSFRYLPDYMGAIVALMAFVLLMLAYVFGRVSIQMSVGKFLQKTIFSGRSRSETIALLIGVLTFTLLLSMPYIWIIVLLTLLAGSTGLVATARTKPTWSRE
jgi:hypothetical protein